MQKIVPHIWLDKQVKYILWTNKLTTYTMWSNT